MCLCDVCVLLQGFILDGFPKTYEQAKELFAREPFAAFLPSHVRVCIYGCEVIFLQLMKMGRRRRRRGEMMYPHSTTGPSCQVSIEMHPYSCVLQLMGVWSMVGVSQPVAAEVVVSLDADDGFLKERVMNLPESVVAGTHYTQHGRRVRNTCCTHTTFEVVDAGTQRHTGQQRCGSQRITLASAEYLAKLAKFRTLNEEDVTVLNYFDELEVHPEHFGRVQGESVTPCQLQFDMHFYQVFLLFKISLGTLATTWRTL